MGQLKRTLIKHLDELPMLPTVVGELMRLDRRNEGYPEQVVQLVESEPNFAARILATANSAASSPSSRVVTLGQAIVRLGAGPAADLVIATAITKVFVPRDDWERSLWRHAIQVAVGCRTLARSLCPGDVDPDTAYTCGLLHDVGRFVMFSEAPLELRRIDEAGFEDAATLIEQEKALCGTTHAELGALACDKWRLAEAVSENARSHHRRALPRPKSDAEKLSALVQSADLLLFASAVPDAPRFEEQDDEAIAGAVASRLPDFLQVSVPRLRKVMERVYVETDVVLERLGIG